MTEAGAALTLRLSGSSTVLGTAVAAADGSFHFSGISLSLGANAFVLTLADAAGNTSTSSLTLTRDPSTAADTLPPTLSAALANDTGASASDGITSDPAIAGDLKTVREQAQRCRDILGKIAQLSSSGAPFDNMKLSTLIEEAVAPHRDFGINIKVRLAVAATREPVAARNPAILYGV